MSMSYYTEIDGSMVSLTDAFSFELADKVVQTGRSGDSRKLQNNTWLHRIDEHTIGVRLHNTDVVLIHDDGSYTLDTGGWYTVTTKDRINSYLPRPLRVYSKRGRWSLWNWETHEEVHRFFDGIRVSVDGTVLNPRRAEMEAQDAREKDIEKRMNKYIRKFLHALRDGIPMPSGGDCWGCTSGGALGDSHLLDHFDEDYFVPSLLINAYAARGYGDWRVVLSMDMDYDWLKEDKGIRLRRKWTAPGEPKSEEPELHGTTNIGRTLRRYIKPLVLPEVQR